MTTRSPKTTAHTPAYPYRVVLLTPDESQVATNTIARNIVEFIASRGLSIAEEDGCDDVDAAIILLVPNQSYDQLWQRVVTAIRPRRIVPIQIGDISGNELPSELAAIQWLPWTPQRSQEFYGGLLASLRRNPDALHRTRELSDEAEAWASQGHRDALLINDLGRAREMQNLLAQGTSDPSVLVTTTTTQFVDRSLQFAKKTRRRRRRWIVIGAVTVLVAAAVGVPALLRLHNLGQTNGQSFVTSGELTESALPEWTALLSGALLLDGDAAQRSLARVTLLDTMLSTPYWSLGSIDVGPGYSVEDVFRVSAPGTVGVLVGAGSRTDLAAFTIRTGQLKIEDSVPGDYWYADSLNGGATVAMAGPNGVAFVNTSIRSTTTIRLAGRVSGAVLQSPNQLYVVVGDSNLYVVSPGSQPRLVGTYPEVLDLERASSGQVEALVEVGPGGYRVVDLANGSIVAQALAPPPVVAAGGLSVDGNGAYVAGQDGQIWSFDSVGMTPTGIPVTDHEDVIHALPGNRLVVGGWTEPATVFDLRTGSSVGAVCSDAPRLNEIKTFDNGTMIACQGGAQTTFWPTPSGPSSARSIRWSVSSHSGDVQRDGVRILARGGSLQIQHPIGHNRSSTTPWTSLFPDPVTVSAVSSNGTTAVVATSSGEVAVLDVGRDGIQVVGLWNIPGRVSARTVGFAPGPVVVDARDQAWQVPQCAHCGTDAGLVSQLRLRLTGCWFSHQLMSIDQSMRTRLGIELCQPLDGQTGT